MAGGGPSYTEAELALLQVEKNVRKAAKDEKLFIELVVAGSVDFLRSFLKKNPAALQKKYEWQAGGTVYAGPLLHLAASINSPAMVRMLVTEFGAPLDKRMEGERAWTALHCACHNDAYEAAQALVKLGADPLAKAQKGETAFSLSPSERMKMLVNADYAKQREDEKAERLRTQEAAALAQQRRNMSEKIEGTWYSPHPCEVVHVHERPDLGLHLTDIFNFETRSWRSLVRDVNNGSMAQDVIFFSSIPDTAVLQKAIHKMRECGGQVDEGDMGLLSKSPLPKKLPNPST